MSKFAKLRLIKGVVVSEKSSGLGRINQYVLKVESSATKSDILSAVELGFGVKVYKVNVLNVDGKVKRFGRTVGRRSDWKKAYVTLKEGYALSVAG